MPPRHPSHPGGSLGTAGPGRAETAGAEEHLLGWTGSEGAQWGGAGDERCGMAGAAGEFRLAGAAGSGGAAGEFRLAGAAGSGGAAGAVLSAGAAGSGGAAGAARSAGTAGPGGAAGSAAAVRQVEPGILAESGTLLESEHWSSGSGGRLGRQAEGRRGVGLERGGEAGAAGEGGTLHLGLSGNPAPGPHQAGTGWQREDSVAQRPPQGLSQSHVARGEDEPRGPVDPQPGCTSLPGVVAEPEDKTQAWRLGFGWSETWLRRLQQLPEKKEPADVADYCFWTRKCQSKFSHVLCSPTATKTCAYFLPGLCVVIGGAWWTRAACCATEDEGVV